MDLIRSTGENPLSVKGLYPTLSEEQLREAEENLDRYLELSLRMHERIRNDPVEYSRFKELTGSPGSATIAEQNCAET